MILHRHFVPNNTVSVALFSVTGDNPPPECLINHPASARSRPTT